MNDKFRELIDRLRESEIMVDKNNLSIAIPSGTELTHENIKDIEVLTNHGYLPIHATVTQSRLILKK